MESRGKINANEQETGDIDTNEDVCVKPSWITNISREERIEEDMKNFDYDKLFAEINPQQVNRVTRQSSVITSVLRQLLKTLNPSKVRLPACVLECRPLLESYGAAFARSDLFIAIPAGVSPLERLERVAAFYLSQLKCMRTTAVALKPYNPTLGEFYICEWPSPLSRDLTVSFLAEQISHHPPVSALYAECRTAGVSFTASIATISGIRLKYFSVPDVLTVDDEGEARILLQQHSEQFTFTFPSAEVRDILSSDPRVEVTGSTVLSCDTHGTTVQFQFHGEDSVRAKVVDSSGQTVSELEGSWRGLVQVWEREGHRRVLVDMTGWKEPQVAAVVAPVSRQGDRESRRQWRKLTRALVLNPEEADDRKWEVEEEAKGREREGYSPVFFHVNQSQNVSFKYCQ